MSRLLFAIYHRGIIDWQFFSGVTTDNFFVMLEQEWDQKRTDLVDVLE